MSRTPELVEDSVPLRVAVLAALMLASVGVLREGVGGALLWAVVLVGYPTAFAVGYLTRRSRPILLRALATGTALVVLLAFAASATVSTLADLAALQVPLAEVFLWLLLLHALDVPARRGLLVSLLASLVLVALAGALSISMALAPFLAGWAVAAMGALVLAHRRELATIPALAREQPRTAFTMRSVGTALASLAAVVAIGAGAFMLVPVAGTDRALTFPAELATSESVPVPGGLSNPTLGSADPSRPSRPGEPSRGRASFGYFGFSDRLDTSLRGRPDDTLVMRVRASAPDFWRGQTFDAWDGRVWRVTRSKPRLVRGGQPIALPRVEDDGPAVGSVGVDELVQTYYLEKNGPNAIFAASVPTKLYFPERSVFQMPDGSLRAGVRLDEDSIYTVVSQRNLVTADALRTADGYVVPETIAMRYAQPPTTTERVRALAASVTATSPTTYDKIRALEQWMAEHTRYTLDIPPLPPGADAVDEFLFEQRRGFCEQIGSSLVVMARTLGIPARLVVGYTPGERNPFTGLYEVRASDAHSWAEIYFPGIGWQGFDPTADVPLAGDSSIDSAGAGAFSYLSARLAMPDWAPVALAVLLLAGGIVVTVLALRRRHRDRPAPPTSWAATRLARLEQLGARRGRSRAPAESTPHYAQALATLDETRADAITTAGRVIDAAMFSARPVEATGRATVEALLDELEATWSRTRHPGDLIPAE